MQHDTPSPAPLDVADLLALFQANPHAAYAALARLTSAQLTMQALCVAAALDLDDALLLAHWERRIARLAI